MRGGEFWTGVICALASAASFGMIPLFAVPLINSGVSPLAAVLYRFGLAALIMGPALFLIGTPLRISLRQTLILALLALFYFLDVLFFFLAFKYLASGLASALEFLAPVFVLLITTVCFHQKLRWQAVAAALLAMLGVWLLGGGMESAPLHNQSEALKGSALALLSALFLAFYLIGWEIGGAKSLNPVIATFYLMLFGSIYCAVSVLAAGALVLPDSLANMARAVLLALVTAIFSNWTLILAIKRAGPFLTSILGVLEPLTALFIGATVFEERLSLWMGAGAFMLIAAATLATLAESRKAD